MNLKVKVVGTEHIQQFWPLVESYIKSALDEGLPYPDWSRSYNIHHIQAFLTSGEWVLLVASDEENKIHGAMTLSFVSCPLHRIAFITATGGKFITNKETFNQVKEIVKYYGATKLQAYCRDSMVRYLKRFDFEPRNTLVEVLV